MSISESPEGLNKTQSILACLYQRLVKHSQMSSGLSQKLNIKQNHQNKQVCSLTNQQNQRNSTFQNQSNFSPTTKNRILCSQPSDTQLKNMSNEDNKYADHEHSNNCCFLLNSTLRKKVKKIDKNQHLLQSYREQVEYLKKLSFLQSQQIQKLRRMLRNHQQSQYSRKDEANAKTKQQNKMKQKDKKMHKSTIYEPKQGKQHDKIQKRKSSLIKK